MQPNAPRAVLLTGARGAGKTTLCLRLASDFPGRFAGLACPALFDEEGRKVGFRARCLETGDSWELGRSDSVLDGPRTGRFSFSRAGVERAIACLRLAITHRGRITVIDEIGPLELQKGEGFAPMLPILASAGDLLLTVRPELLEALPALMPRHRIASVIVSEGNRDAAERRILEVFWPKEPV
jgi:nucleoside-triphosphatase THEP1